MHQLDFIRKLSEKRSKFTELLNHEKIKDYVISIVADNNNVYFSKYIFNAKKNADMASYDGQIKFEDYRSSLAYWGALVASVSKSSRRNVLLVILLDIAEKEKLSLTYQAAKRFFKFFIGKTSSNEILNNLFSGLFFNKKDNKLVKINRTPKERVINDDYDDLFKKIMNKYSKRINVALNIERDIFNRQRILYKDEFKLFMKKYTIIRNTEE